MKGEQSAANAKATVPTVSLNQQKAPTQFEKDTIGSFALQLYLKGNISANGIIEKKIVRNKFKKFIEDNSGYEVHFGSANIGTSLRASNFLINTPRKSKFYCLCISKIIEFNTRRMKLLQRDYAGSFLLTLLHQEKIKKNGSIKISIIQSAFQEYLQKTETKYQIYFKDVVIGTLLYKTNFLFNTPRGSEEYCISMRALYEYRNEKLKQLDASQISNQPGVNFIFPGNTESNEAVYEQAVEISPDAEEFPVIYQGGFEQLVDPNFNLTNLGCFVCQENFSKQSLFEDHISTHGFETDFEFLTASHKQQKNNFEIIYRLCNESHFFYFTMKTNKKDLIVEKIIIVQTRLMNYVKNNKMPYEIPTDGIDSFLVDSHLFTIGVEQPIVVVYRNKFDKTVRFVEQHHFLRTEEFPQVHFPIKACRLPYNRVMKLKCIIPEYYPSKSMKDAQLDNFSDSSLCKLSEDMRKYIDEGKVLTVRNVCKVFKTLLQIEDLEGMRGYSVLSQRAATIKRFGQEYSVRLRKLPKHIFLENIVSPLDEIILIRSKENGEDILKDFDQLNMGDNRSRKVKKYIAIVERVYYDQICFKYDRATICEKQKYDIILRPSRLSLKYQYRAIEMLSVTESMKLYLFPSSCNSTRTISIEESLKLFNPSIENNPEQLQAVQNIAKGPSHVAPYIVFGPPGTGKTSTIVEAVLQLWQRRPDTRILITAGSNSACDEVAVRLCRVLIDLEPEKTNILRIFARSNEKRLDSIDDILIEASNFYRSHFYPDVEVIREYRIIVCTLSIVGRLVSAAIGNNFFTHIFIDECAASTVPEVLVGCMGVASSKTRIIVSGDYKQLGPILRSPRASELGLGESFMERLINQSCYVVDGNGDYDRSIQTRLIQNFRSNADIVELYNELYYDNQLKAMANKDDTLWALKWHLLPNKNRPIIFHSVYGSCSKSGHSLSLCNELEVNAVMDYVKDLMFFGVNGRKISETDIGIISPYKRQYMRIQEELNQRRWHQIEVGAVETFQGKEKPIIIVSTVRSFTNNLGFLDNPRRLNVILSRAKALLILIGNPKTLSQSKDFKSIIDDCIRTKCTVGRFQGYGEENLPDDREKNKPKHQVIHRHRQRLFEKKSIALNLKAKKTISVAGQNNYCHTPVNTINMKDQIRSKLLESSQRDTSTLKVEKSDDSNNIALASTTSILKTPNVPKFEYNYTSNHFKTVPDKRESDKPINWRDNAYPIALASTTSILKTPNVPNVECKYTSTHFKTVPDKRESDKPINWRDKAYPIPLVNPTGISKTLKMPSNTINIRDQLRSKLLESSQRNTSTLKVEKQEHSNNIALGSTTSILKTPNVPKIKYESTSIHFKTVPDMRESDKPINWRDNAYASGRTYKPVEIPEYRYEPYIPQFNVSNDMRESPEKKRSIKKNGCQLS